MPTIPVPASLAEQDRRDYQSRGDRRRAAALLTGVVAGDWPGVTANLIAAQRADKIGPTIAVVLDVVVWVLPELRTTELVDLLRSIASDPSKSRVEVPDR